VCKVRVLHDLGEEEALLVVILGAAIGLVHIGYSSEAGVGATGRVDGDECVPDPVAVLRFR
jgi:hypothetical protein